MKRLSNCILPVEIGYPLNEVASIKFKFVQDSRTLMFDYPSEKSEREQGKDIVLLRWTADETRLFASDRPIKMDTYIVLSNSEQNPTTDIVEFSIAPTLFRREELLSDD